MPQFHLHFAARATDRTPPGAGTGLFPPPANHGVHGIVMAWRATTVRHAMVVSRPTHDRHSARRGALARRPVAAAGQAARPARLVSRRAPIATAIVTPVERGPRGLLFEKPLPLVRAARSLDERAGPPVARARTRRPEAAVIRTRRLTLASAEPLRPPDPAPYRAPGRTSPELVWRRGSPAPASLTDAAPQRELPPPPHQAQGRTSPGSEAGAGAAGPRPERAAGTQGATLDPGLLDRLADDVVRRVERRARIERERRGI
jgi:hypothetical protein